MVEIAGSNYHVTYEPETQIISIRGVLRLYGTDGYIALNDDARNRSAAPTPSASQPVASGGYSSIMKLLMDVVYQHPADLTLDVQELQFVNSSAINILSKFVMLVAEEQQTHLRVLGNQKLYWQPQVLNNLKTLLPSATIVF